MRQASKKLSRSSNHWKKKFFRKKELKEIKKLKIQLKWAVTELEDFRNHLIFKSIEQKPNKTWEDTPKIFGDFLVLEVNLPYTYKKN